MNGGRRRSARRVGVLAAAIFIATVVTADGLLADDPTLLDRADPMVGQSVAGERLAEAVASRRWCVSRLAIDDAKRRSPSGSDSI